MKGSEALPGAVGEDQHPAAVEEAVLELSRVARPVAEGQLTQAVTQTCSQSDNRFKQVINPGCNDDANKGRLVCLLFPIRLASFKANGPLAALWSLRPEPAADVTAERERRTFWHLHQTEVVVKRRTTTLF